ncbi:MAG: sulfotransferase [Rhodothermaceae bacterium]|nr:sulfotransferase [Rhodothermaceae bacterium]MXZ59140.1 sulfotransferase [Rhodothermaceae bacterium]MYB90281.1 sulfotransferase [Rhodothermaceae bacterium]MYD68543.1 sulfotransferase [Rhodothermaceae bacterium]MYG45674.1 sulfotransferase [Rhodothermaceae bacterium]
MWQEMGKSDFVTTTDYERPYRPFFIKVYNGLSGRFGPPGYLEAEVLVEQAKRITGLEDLGDSKFFEALEVLVKSMNDEARLTATGRLVQKSRLTRALVHRFRIRDLLRKHPEINEVDLGKIILVTGLQRTGTTLLQRLLNTNPAIRGISGGELLEPVPAGNMNRRGTFSRKFYSFMAHQAISYLSPQFKSIHPISRREPEEDVMLLDLSFMSQSPEATMHVPSYSRWLEDQDHTQAYEFLRGVLKVLCWQRPGSQWVLKTPNHMEYLDIFLNTFPDAKIVLTHRDPRKALPSFCSMVAHGRGIFSDQVDPEEIARHWCRKIRRMIEVTEMVRSGEETDRFMDVSYYDLIADPVTQLREIYEWIGINFDDEAVRQAGQYIKANPQNRFGRHSYSLNDFGLSEEVIEEHFSGYREKYTIPFE